jgi:hypothetical protein
MVAMRPQSSSDRQQTFLYTHHLLQSPTRSKTDSYSSTVMPYTLHDSLSRGQYQYDPPLDLPPTLAASPLSPHPDPASFPSPQAIHRYQPSVSQSTTRSTNYATEYAPSNSKLHLQRSRKSYNTSRKGDQQPGPRAVGPALAGGVYSVLPKPRSVVKSIRPISAARRFLQRSTPDIDEDEEASNALNTYG